MSYSLRISQSAERELDRLSPTVHSRISRRIQSLRDNPRPKGVRKLRGREEEYRLRAGDYRVLYTINDTNNVVTIFSVGHRREVYR